MVSSVILKNKTANSVSINTDSINELIGFAEFVKAYSKDAVSVHNSCLTGSTASEYQQELKRNKNHAKNQHKLAIAALELENTPENQQAVSNWKTLLDTLSSQIQSDIIKAKTQYLLIRQSNWIFVTLYELIKQNHPSVQGAILGHSIGDRNDAILIIQIGDQQLSCPKGFTNLDLDSDGFQNTLEHNPIEPGVYYEGVKDILEFKPEILQLIQKSRQQYITYDVK
jgi:hypothetical protein